ncbi:MAG TPA: Na/Pi symporter [Polyangiales bacterium]|nr:Na/Pi symporter [Polyangiales bacterium]
MRHIARLAVIALLALTPVAFAQPAPETNSGQVESPPSADKPPNDKPTGEKPRAQTATDKDQSLSYKDMGLAALAGLVLFIFGVTQLSKGLEELNTERMRNTLARFTSNRFAGVATGIVATTLLESSSVTIIMVIAMVSGGVLTFVQSLGVVLGANIGTTVGAQIIAFNVAAYSPLLMLAGLLCIFIGKANTRKQIGLILLGFGLIFYGLEAIDDAMKPLRTHEPFLHWMERLGTSPWLGAFVGCVVTLVIQSSSATVAIVIKLASSGLISLPAGVAIMLGAEIGTCSDTLLATIGRGRPALRTGVFHLSFNLVTAVLGVLLAEQLVKLVELVSAGVSTGRQIANAQIIFNVIGVAAVLPFLPAVARVLQRMIPDASTERADVPEQHPRQLSGV